MDYIKINKNSCLYNGKAEEVIPKLENNSIDLVITSPPYNVDLGNNKYNKNPYDLYNDNKDHKNYIIWLKTIFQSLYPKLKKGSRICVNVGDGRHGKIPTHSDIIQFMVSDLKYILMATIIWEKNQVGNRLSWGSFCSPSSPCFPTPFEFILVFSKETTKLQTSGQSTLHSKNFIDWAYSLWKFAPEKNMEDYGHPAVFPVELPYRLINMLSWKDALVLDPFNGAGTTGVACEMSGRNYIGIEISKKYCDITVNRIKNTRPLSESNIFE